MNECMNEWINEWITEMKEMKCINDWMPWNGMQRMNAMKWHWTWLLHLNEMAMDMDEWLNEWNELMKWNEMNGMKWNEMRWNETN